MEHKQLNSVHYWIQTHSDPDAHCLIFTHGMAADHSMFDGQMAHFSATCTVIAWDMPLHGLSVGCQQYSLQLGQSRRGER